mmetsp:Transcript_46810/g.150428  ORF Transcript_46810/g.150428 Transcript_46810/m.150428 type:complete len:271 (+) Transcript_46810:2053-2865(+)
MMSMWSRRELYSNRSTSSKTMAFKLLRLKRPSVRWSTRRPGVAITIAGWSFFKSSSSCATLLPPTKQETFKFSKGFKRSRRMRHCCCASSREGVTMITGGPTQIFGLTTCFRANGWRNPTFFLNSSSWFLFIILFFSGSTYFDTKGMRKAKVFPQPVIAVRITSLLDKMAGIALACKLFGPSMPKSWRVASTSGMPGPSRPSSCQPQPAGSVQLLLPSTMNHGNLFSFLTTERTAFAWSPPPMRSTHDCPFLIMSCTSSSLSGTGSMSNE